MGCVVKLSLAFSPRGGDDPLPTTPSPPDIRLPFRPSCDPCCCHSVASSLALILAAVRLQVFPPGPIGDEPARRHGSSKPGAPRNMNTSQWLVVQLAGGRSSECGGSFFLLASTSPLSLQHTAPLSTPMVVSSSALSTTGRCLAQLPCAERLAFSTTLSDSCTAPRRSPQAHACTANDEELLAPSPWTSTGWLCLCEAPLAVVFV